MKKILLLLLGLNLINCYSQNRIKFSYDATGNQKQRYICLSCPMAKQSKDSIYKDFNDVTEDDLIKDEYEQVKYYPNPVLEELYIKWTNTDQLFVANVALYSLNGQLIKEYKMSRTQETAKVAFSTLPDGYYSVVLLYSNEERKTLKIVKQK